MVTGRVAELDEVLKANVGAVLSSYGMYIPTSCYVDGLPGSYVLPAMSVDVRGVFTNTSPVDAYRGAGRAEGTYAVERVIDMASETLGIDPVELRFRNTLDEVGENGVQVMPAAHGNLLLAARQQPQH